MPFFVYMLKSVSHQKTKTYVGYTNDIVKRLSKHNSNKGAKSTNGYKWSIIYKKKFINKSDAMKYEYILKNNKKKRKNLLKKYLLK